MIITSHFFRAAEAVQAGLDIGAEKSALVKRREEMNAVVQFALRTLRDNSPVGGANDPHPGRYRDSHTLFVNGNDQADLSTWFPGDEIEISNPVPYARILELGDGKVRVAHHTYELTEQAVQQKYGEIVRVELNYLPVKFGGAEAWSKSSSGRRVRRSTEWLSRQPSLKIMGLDS